MSIEDFDQLNQDERLLASKLGFSKHDFAPSARVEESIRAEARRAELHAPSRLGAVTGWLKYGGVAAAFLLALGVAWKTMRTPHPNGIDAMHAPVAIEVDPKTQAMDTSQAEPSAAERSTEDAPVAANEAPVPVRKNAHEPPVATPIPKRSAPAAEAASEEARSVVTSRDPSVQTQMETAAAVAAETRAKQVMSKPDVQDSARRANEAAANAPRASSSKTPMPAPVKTMADRPAATPFATTPAAADATGALENGYDERPPKTTAAQDVQQAWLKRIRTLRLAGKQEEAAASLEAWHKRYPDATIPADLLPLRRVTPRP